MSRRLSHDWEAVLRRIEAGERVDARAGGAAGMPVYSSIARQAARNPDWGRRYRAAIAGRASTQQQVYDWDAVARHIIGGAKVHYRRGGRPAYMPDYHAIWKHARRYPDWAHQVAAGMRAASAAKSKPEGLLDKIKRHIPPGLPPDLRADLTQDVAMAVLEGRASGDLAGCVKLCLTRHRKVMGTWRELSLDAPMPGFDGRLSYLDALPSEALHL